MVQLRLEWITKSHRFYVCICELPPDLFKSLSFAGSYYSTLMLLQNSFCQDVSSSEKFMERTLTLALKYRVLITFQVIPLNWVKICRILKKKQNWIHKTADKKIKITKN